MPSDAHDPQIDSRWRQAFSASLQAPENAEPLKQAAVAGKMAAWTKQLTAVLVQSCQAMGWSAAAKGHPLNLLPQLGQEYLGMDVMAFEPQRDAGEPCWRFPIAVFELENSRGDDRVAYSLWKVLCLNCRLRIVFAYRQDWEEGRKLVGKLSADVVGAMPISQCNELIGTTLLVIGSRGEGETFPWGYFKLWELSANLGRFEKI
jgi:hypothetical protein